MGERKEKTLGCDEGGRNAKELRGERERRRIFFLRHESCPAWWNTEERGRGREGWRCIGPAGAKEGRRMVETGYRRGKHAKVMLLSVLLFVTTKCRESSRI